MNVEKYDSLRSRHERSKFIASLAQTMKYEVGFRFLKRKGGEQLELTDEEVRAKIGHALRDLSTSLRENASNQDADSRVPRPLPYKKQDKDQIKTFIKPTTHLNSLPASLQTAEISSRFEACQTIHPAEISPVTKPSEIVSDDDLDGILFPLEPLEMGDACRSLLSQVPMDLLPSLDEEDCFPTLPEETTSMAPIQARTTSTSTASTAGGFGDDANCDTSLPSSCCLSDAMETLSLVSA